MRAGAALLLAAALLAAIAGPAQALSFGPPGCHAFDRALREAPNATVIRIVWAGEPRHEGDGVVTPVRAVVEEVVKGRAVRRDQTLAWEDRVSDASLEVFAMQRPHYALGVDHLASIDAEGRVELWPDVGFYASNLRTCYRRSLVSPAG